MHETPIESNLRISEPLDSEPVDSEPVPGTEARADRLSGVNGIRSVALIWVFLQHLLSVTDNASWTNVGSFSIGQAGVALFLSISGLLAATSNKPANEWIYARAVKIYPAYWIATLGSLLLAGLFGYKRFGAFQVASQLLGTGLFTHPNNLVNIATWFISLLLAMYLLTYVAKLTQHDFPVMLIASFLLLAMILYGKANFLLAHALTYTLSYSWTKYCQRNGEQNHAIWITLLFFIFVLWKPVLAYSLFAMVVVQVFKQSRIQSRLLERLADISYEFYLVHGVVLVGTSLFLSASVFVCGPIGFVLSVLTARALRFTSRLFAV